MFCLASFPAHSQGFNTTAEFAAMCSGDPRQFEDEFTAEIFRMNCERYLAGLVDGFVIAQQAGRPISISPAQAVLSMLSEARQAHELGEIERRIGELEQQKELRK